MARRKAEYVVVGGPLPYILGNSRLACADCTATAYVGDESAKKRVAAGARVLCAECWLRAAVLDGGDVELEVGEDTLANVSAYFGRPFTREDLAAFVESEVRANWRRFRP